MSFLFSNGIPISPTSLGFTSSIGCSFKCFSAIFFPKNSPTTSAVLWISHFEEVFKAVNLVFGAVSNNFLSYLLDRFLANDKSAYPLT